MKPKRAILPGRCRAYLSSLELADWDRKGSAVMNRCSLLRPMMRRFQLQGHKEMCVAADAYCFRFWTTQRPLWGWIRAGHSVKGRVGWRMRRLSLAADRPGNPPIRWNCCQVLIQNPTRGTISAQG